MDVLEPANSDLRSRIRALVADHKAALRDIAVEAIKAKLLLPAGTREIDAIRSIETAMRAETDAAKVKAMNIDRGERYAEYGQVVVSQAGRQPYPPALDTRIAQARDIERRVEHLSDQLAIATAQRFALEEPEKKRQLSGWSMIAVAIMVLLVVLVLVAMFGRGLLLALAR